MRDGPLLKVLTRDAEVTVNREDGTIIVDEWYLNEFPDGSHARESQHAENASTFQKLENLWKQFIKDV